MSSIETYLGFTAWGNKKYPYIRQQHVNTVCCMCGDMLYASDNSYWIVGFDQKPRAMHAIQCIPRFDIIFIMPLAEFRFSNACQNIYCVQELGQFSMRTKEQAMHECSRSEERRVGKECRS